MAEILFLFDVCLCVRLCAAASQSVLFKTVKATDFKFDMHVPEDNPDMTLNFFSKGCVARVA